MLIRRAGRLKELRKKIQNLINIAHEEKASFLRFSLRESEGIIDVSMIIPVDTISQEDWPLIQRIISEMSKADHGTKEGVNVHTLEHTENGRSETLGAAVSETAINLKLPK